MERLHSFSSNLYTELAILNKTVHLYVGYIDNAPTYHVHDIAEFKQHIGNHNIIEYNYPIKVVTRYDHISDVPFNLSIK